MRDPWIRQYFGPEATPRPGFRDELADELVAEWQGARAAEHLSGAASSDDLWAGTRADASRSPDSPGAAAHGSGHRPVALQRRPDGSHTPEARSRRWGAFALVAAAVLAAVAVVVWRQQSNDSTNTADSPGATAPGGGTAQAGSTVPGQTTAPGDTSGGTPSASTSVDPGDGTAQGTQYMSPACFETRPTTAIPAAIDPAVLAGGANTAVAPTFLITLPEPQAGASFTSSTVDVRVVPGGVLMKVSLALPDGTAGDTMLSVVNNDGVVRWTRCFTNAYNVGPFGENGDGSLTIWVARNTTSLARYVNLSTGETSDLFSGYTPTANAEGLTGLATSLDGNELLVWLPEAAAVGNHQITLP